MDRVPSKTASKSTPESGRMTRGMDLAKKYTRTNGIAIKVNL